jgi:epoxyqueuosine reductase
MTSQDMSVNVRETLRSAGCDAVVVSIDRLEEAQAAISRLVGRGLVDRRLSKDWRFYLEANDSLPGARTIVVVAVPQPVVRVGFRWQGKDCPAEIAPGYFSRVDESRAEELLNNTLAAAGYEMVRAHLPLKTLAVRAGLAEYGRNNITYVPGMGSFFRLLAFFSDCPCDEDNWGKYRVMSACNDCSLCSRNCPTACIGDERFLIHAENCLGYLGQRQPDFPYWVRLQPDWPAGLVGCMRCQSVCPVNRPYLDNNRDGPYFSEEETRLVLEAVPLDRLPPETRRKLSGMSGFIYPLLACNLRELIDRLEDSV